MRYGFSFGNRLDYIFMGRSAIMILKIDWMDEANLMNAAANDSIPGGYMPYTCHRVPEAATMPPLFRTLRAILIRGVKRVFKKRRRIRALRGRV